MTPKRSVNAGALPAFEPLEARLLLSADALTGDAALAPPDGTVVTAELEAESLGGPSNNDLASAQELSFSYVVPWVNPDDGFGPQQAAVVGTADGSGGGEAYDRSFGLYLVIDGDYPPFGLDFPDATTPGGDGLLTISAYADLEGTDKYLTLEGEGILLGHLFVIKVSCPSSRHCILFEAFIWGEGSSSEALPEGFWSYL